MTSLIIPVALFAVWASALRRGGRYDLIATTPYNNRYSDATGARDERAMLS